MRLFVAMFVCVFYWAGAAAQDSGGSRGVESEGLNGYWQAFVGGGHYMVNLEAVVSVSKHSFIQDGVARVVEVTVGTTSAVSARFYFLEELPAGSAALAAPQQVLSKAQELASQVAQRAGALDPNLAKTQVVKSYPMSTHAHTVEYVMSSENSLNSLYNSLTRAVASRSEGVSWSEN